MSAHTLDFTVRIGLIHFIKFRLDTSENVFFQQQDEDPTKTRIRYNFLGAV